MDPTFSPKHQNTTNFEITQMFYCKDLKSTSPRTPLISGYGKKNSHMCNQGPISSIALAMPLLTNSRHPLFSQLLAIFVAVCFAVSLRVMSSSRSLAW